MAQNVALLGLALIAISASIAALPVTQNKKDHKEAAESSTPATADVETALEYERYLREVVEALEADPEFRKKLDKAPEADIRVKWQDRTGAGLREPPCTDQAGRDQAPRSGASNQAYELSNDIDRKHLKVSQHLDHDNEHTFEIEDLRKLIQKTSDDLAEADRKRRGEFKEYEMQKEFEREAQKKEMDEESRKKFEAEVKEKEEKHKNHEKLHHPGNKAQLEDVWEKQDHMDKNDFDPKTFFSIHDIAQELDYVNHHVRTKLDEIKRREVERLRELANQAYELSNDIDRKHLKVSQHLDHDNEHTFEIEDLRKLIQKTSDDLAEADRKRRGEFKEYEMQKEFEREAQKKEMDEESRKKFEAEVKEKEEKHKNHEKLHHPGNKAQLEDVWEKQDHMDKNDFDPKTFFSIHDVDSNGYWDEAEVKALFVKELDKVYQSDLPEDDMRERAEEMERMREHYFQETDMNHDGLISIDEFMVQTNKEEFQKDPEWETIDRQQQYTHEEYLEYERRRQEEVQRLFVLGQLPPHPNMPQG
ncbi:GD12377 [Drosophila simulans]|uniref:GD12377 n=1 Tax=Drosophila simulans TaxID=7240 RepID=B4QPA6_DROSI|nr:GD12377 [Drosophila simulans]